MKTTLLLSAILIFISSETISAQHTTRTRLKARQEVISKPTNVQIYDTIATAADSALLSFAGYEKTLSSTKESFFITNHTDSAITRLELVIDYLDMKGRQLDSRPVTVDIELPPHETRRVDISAWDRQKVFYYHLSPTPRASHATPYRIKINLRTALRAKK